MIDVHHHVLPEFYVRALKQRGVAESGGAPLPDWDLDDALELMDRQNIETAILSISSPGIYFGEQAFATAMARNLNDYLAELVAHYPIKFGAFAAVPLPDVAAAVEEIGYALDVLKFDGVCLLANVGGEYVGSSAWSELYEELDRRGAVVFLHPTDTPNAAIRGLDVPSFAVDFVFDTTRAVANLLYQKTFEKYPNIKWILSHAGGAVPYLAHRLALGYEQKNPTISDAITHIAEQVTGASYRSPEEEGARALKLLRGLYYDTALSASPFAFNSLTELVDVPQILFGTDYPYAWEFVVAQTVQGVQDFKGFSALQPQIFRDNAFKLFPRFNK